MSAEPEDINRLSLADSLLRENFEMIRHADRKAQALLRITMAIFAAAFIGVPPAVLALKDTIEQGGAKFGLFVAVIGLYAVCTLCLLHVDHHDHWRDPAANGR